MKLRLSVLSLLLASSFLTLCAARFDALPRDTLPAPDTCEVDTLGEPAYVNEPLPQRIEKLLADPIFERTQVGIYVWDLTADTLVFAHNERQCMRPASCEKLITAITALDYLGTNYSYHTQLYATPPSADSLAPRCIYIKAGYDPLLSEEDLCAITDSLRAAGIDSIAAPIVLDLSFKDRNRLGWGWCWDDDVTPTLPLLFDGQDTFTYHLRQAMQKAGISWDGRVVYAEVPDTAAMLCERSHGIDQILLPMMKRSNNCMAESLFYQIAHKAGGAYAGRKQATACVEQLIRKMGLTPSHYQIADGSGLSLYNYVTPQLLGNFLRYAFQNKSIYNHLLPSLPIAGVDGTLHRRLRGASTLWNVKAKTGTVEGISSLAGYLTSRDGNQLCFCIINQGLRHTSTGHHFQDRLCHALCE